MAIVHSLKCTVLFSFIVSLLSYPSQHRRLSGFLKSSRRLTTKLDGVTTPERSFTLPDLRCLEDVQFTTSWDVWFTMSSWRLVYNILKTSDLRRLKDVQFATSWKRLIYGVFRTSDLRRLEDVRFTSSWRSSIYDVLKTSDLRHLEDVWYMTSWRRLICTVWNIQKILSVPVYVGIWVWNFVQINGLVYIW